MVRRSRRLAAIADTEVDHFEADLVLDAEIPKNGGRFRLKKSSNKIKESTNQKIDCANAVILKEDSLANDEVHGLKREKEYQIWKNGMNHIAGVDEAGRGPLAGPVVAAACIVPPHCYFAGVNDSKQIKEEDRERLFEEITNHPDVTFCIQELSHEIIDEINILQATMEAMTKAVEGLKIKAEHVLIDGNRVPSKLTENFTSIEAIVKGDSKVYSIACASILAKVYRDRIMYEAHKKWPVYGFAQNKGYPTVHHRSMVATHGACEIHRKTFGPVRKAIEIREKENSDSPKSDCVKASNLQKGKPKRVAQSSSNVTILSKRSRKKTKKV